jgi:hypothetical protein
VDTPSRSRGDGTPSSAVKNFDYKPAKRHYYHFGVRNLLLRGSNVIRRKIWNSCISECGNNNKKNLELVFVFNHYYSQNTTTATTMTKIKTTTTATTTTNDEEMFWQALMERLFHSGHAFPE